MYSVASLEKHKEITSYANLTTEQGTKQLEAECNKLVYLTGYPDFVKGNIEGKKSEIRHLEFELQMTVNEGSSHLERIKRRQMMQPGYRELEGVKKELLQLKEELQYAESVRIVAQTRLGVYQNLLSRKKEEVNGDGDRSPHTQQSGTTEVS